jgi:hypothetical protein
LDWGQNGNRKVCAGFQELLEGVITGNIDRREAVGAGFALQEKENGSRKPDISSNSNLFFRPG